MLNCFIISQFQEIGYVKFYYKFFEFIAKNDCSGSNLYCNDYAE